MRRARPILIFVSMKQKARVVAYIKKCCIAAVEVLHVICHIAQHIDEENRSLLMDVRQKTQGMLEILESRGTIIARPLVHRVHESKCDD